MPPEIRQAMTRAPRHEFVPEAWRAEAYEDEPLPLPAAQATISAPHMVALQLEYASIHAGHHVFEVGTGLGYLAALIAELVGPSGKVETIEVDGRLAREARARLARAGYGERVEVHEADGRAGLPGGARFDRGLVSCATPRIEPAWVEMLKPGGILVAPVGGQDEQTLVRLEKSETGTRLVHGPLCRFVPLHSPTPPHI
jgi:protein-L-isoaspartate(D-aspartate) O-methyltransferase